ncbi:fibrinogen-binding adhesin SdrG C-terminal domain-containing protein [Staphylococcus aureus]
MKNSLRYGIRKHKLGAASVFLGTMIVVGMGQDKEAAASEQNTTVEENGNSATENKSKQTTTNNVNNIDETQTYSATSTEQPSNATQVTAEAAPQAVEAPQTSQAPQKVQSTNVETVKEEVVKEEVQPQVKETARSQENSGDQRQVDLTPKKVTQNQGTEPQVEVAQPRTVSESKPRVTRSTDVAEAKDASEIKGTDVTSKVTVESGSIEAPQGNKVEPHAGQRVVLKYKLKFEKGLHKDDYFDFTLSNNVNTHGVSTARKVPDIKNGTVVMATGQLLGNGKIRYTFTDYIDYKVNVTADLEINLFIDPKTVQSNGQQIITSTLNDKETRTTLPIQYNPGVSNSYANVNGSIETFDKGNNKFTHVAYIKPQNGHKSDSVSITGTLTQGSKANGNAPTVKVYEVLKDAKELPESVYANISDSTMFKDVTQEMKDKLKVENNGSYKLDIEKLEKSYVIHYDGEYLSGSDQVNFRTHMFGYPEQQYKYYYTHLGYQLTWDNGLVLYSNKAKGDGTNGTITESNNMTFDEESTKGIVTGAISDHTTVEDTKEYTTESNLIELVDELPEEHGQAQGPIEEITENNQHISHSGLGTENGHGNYGIVEEIEENSHVDIKSELGYEGGQNIGNQSFEEDTEEDKPKYEQGGNIVDIDFDSVPQIQGQNKGDQSFEEDTEEDKPKYEQGGNIVDIDFDSVPQIQGQNKGNQSFEEDTEKDKPKYEHGGNIIDIDFDSVPHIHGFNKHTEIIEEDTNKDKPSYQFGGHNSVDFEEDTLPQVSGQNEGQQTIEEDTTPPIVPPTPPTPEVPSEPETPTPPTPEVPSEPETPTPTPPTPEVPSEPETPTPPTPEVPSEPETPTPPMPEIPAEPGKPVPPANEEPKKPSKPVEQGKVVTPVIEINEKVKAVKPAKTSQSKKTELPETGGEETTNNGVLFGGLLSIIGLVLLRRNKKNHKA